MNLAGLRSLPGRLSGPADKRGGTAPSPEVSQQLLGLLERVCTKLDELSAVVTGATKSHYTVAETAQRVGRSPFTVRKWIAEGRINATKLAGTGPRGRLLIPRGEMVKLISEGLGGGVSGLVAGESATTASLD